MSTVPHVGFGFKFDKQIVFVFGRPLVRTANTPEHDRLPVYHRWGRSSTLRRPYSQPKRRNPSGIGAKARGGQTRSDPRFEADLGCPGSWLGTEEHPPGTQCSIRVLMCLDPSCCGQGLGIGSLRRDTAGQVGWNHNGATHLHQHAIRHKMVGGQNVLALLQRDPCLHNGSDTYQLSLLLLQSNHV